MSARSDRRYWALWWLIVIISLWLRTGFPIHGVGPSGYDDELFIRQARFLGNLQWLGPYGDLTLAKGMFYPLFILVAFLLAIPLNIAEQAVYLAVSACAGVLVLRVTASRRLALALFALLAFNPIVWNPEIESGDPRGALHQPISWRGAARRAPRLPRRCEPILARGLLGRRARLRPRRVLADPRGGALDPARRRDDDT